MAVKKYKPTSAGRRQMATSSFEEITRSTPEKSALDSDVSATSSYPVRRRPSSTIVRT